MDIDNAVSLARRKCRAEQQRRMHEIEKRLDEVEERLREIGDLETQMASHESRTRAELGISSRAEEEGSAAEPKKSSRAVDGSLVEEA